MLDLIDSVERDEYMNQPAIDFSSFITLTC